MAVGSDRRLVAFSLEGHDKAFGLRRAVLDDQYAMHGNGSLVPVGAR